MSDDTDIETPLTIEARAHVTPLPAAAPPEVEDAASEADATVEMEALTLLSWAGALYAPEGFVAEGADGEPMRACGEGRSLENLPSRFMVTEDAVEGLEDARRARRVDE